MSDVPSSRNFDITDSSTTDNSSAKPQQEGSTVQPFYDAGMRLDHSIDKEVPYKRIVDPTVAEEIAFFERDQGRDAALQFEEVKRMEHETGLTEDQRYNVDLIKVFSKEFPYAFEEVINERSGEKLLEIRSVSILEELNRIRSGQTRGVSDERMSALNKFDKLHKEKLKKAREVNTRETPYIILDGNTHYFCRDGVGRGSKNPSSMKNLTPGEMGLLIEQLIVYNEYSRIVKEEANQEKEITPDDIRLLIRVMRTAQ